MAARPRRTECCKALRYACWNAVGMGGRKLELENFLNQPSPIVRSGPDCLFRWGAAGLVGRQPQRQTRGLKLAADHETEKTPTLLRRRELLSDLWTGHANYKPIQSLPYSRYLEHRDNQGHHFSGVSDFVLCTKLGPPPSNH